MPVRDRRSKKEAFLYRAPPSRRHSGSPASGRQCIYYFGRLLPALSWHGLTWRLHVILFSAMRVRAEISDYQETSRYAETMQFCRKLQERSPFVRFSSFGKSPQGRELPLLIVSSRKNFTAARAKNSRSLIVLVINGIHSGEIAGKEASLMLLRDLLIKKQHPDLLKNITLLVVPIFNVDGHERMSPFNRMNQNGPKEMGWRATAQNMNLNRDWIKADQPEMRAMLRLYHEWLPHFVIDNHVSDGADFQYDVTYILDDHEGVAPTVRKYVTQIFEPYLVNALKDTGHITTRYFEMRDPTDPAAGIAGGPIEARFSNGYGTLMNRPNITVETHSLKTFRVRIAAHYDLMLAALRKLEQDADALRIAVSRADTQTIAMGKSKAKRMLFPIRFCPDENRSETFRFRAVEYERKKSALSGKEKVIYGTEPMEMTVNHFPFVKPDVLIHPPLAYAIPPEWTAVIDRLEAHSIRFLRLAKSVTRDFETYRFRNVQWAAEPFESHLRLTYETINVTETRTLPAGTAVVLMNQATNKVTMQLLEPDSNDSLVSWGYFNAIFERKEYGEDYILETLAAEMLWKNPAIRDEFERLLKSDPEFTANPRARLQFFYDRSPYADPYRNAYPIVRIHSNRQLR